MKTFTLNHPSGISASVSSLGATLRTLSVPDRNGNLANILVGPTNPDLWQENTNYFGSTCGRFANRIANGTFTLNGTTYQLPQNNGPNHLHGGNNGFDKVVWDSERTGENSVKFTYVSPDNEEGYPGNLEVSIEYFLHADHLIWKATAVTDQPTPVNLTNHAYFNLTGNPANSVTDHLLQIHAEAFLPVNDTLIPTGELKPVIETPFDFTNPKKIGADLARMESTYDHNFVLTDADQLRLAARVSDPTSGRILELFTNQPGLQFYLSSPHGQENSAFCLESQKFPDSPNQAHFPSSILQPGDTYSHEIRFAFPQPK